jgi:hypothetical protein
MGPSERALIQRQLEAVRAETDPDEREEAWRQGATLSIEQATAEVLDMTAT